MHLEKGQIVIKILISDGVEIASVEEVEKITKKVVTLVDCDIKFDAYTGKEIGTSISGSSHKLIEMEGEPWVSVTPLKRKEKGERRKEREKEKRMNNLHILFLNSIQK